MAPELPGSRRTCPSTEERESDAQSIHLSCRARPCRPGLSGHGVGGADGHVQSEAVPIPGFPHTGNILGAGAALKPNTRSQAPNTAASRRRSSASTSTCPAARSCTRRASHVLARPSLETRAARVVPEGLDRRSRRHAHRRRELRQRTRDRDADGAAVLRPRRRPGVLRATGTRPVRSKSSPRAATSAPRAPASARAHRPKCRWSNRCPGRSTRRPKTINVKAGAAYKKGGKTIYYGTVPKKCPKGGFPLKTEMVFGNVEQSQGTGRNGGSPYKAPCPKK